MREYTKFYVAKVKGKWSEIMVTSTERIKKIEVLNEFKKFDNTLSIKDIWMDINAPSDCPDYFDSSISEISL